MAESPDELEKKFDRLDNAFLFIISLVGLLFTIIQVATEGITGLLEIAPLLILGIVFPFYVGYIRGTIERPFSIVERAKGWVYLTVGVIAYFAFFIESFGISYDYGFIVYMLIVGFGALSIYYLEKWLTKFFHLCEKITNLYAFYGATIASVGFAFAFRFIIFVPKFPDFYVVIPILISVAAFTTSMTIEKISRQILKESFTLERAQNDNISRFLSRLSVMGLDLIGSILLSKDNKQNFLTFLSFAFAIILIFTSGIHQVFFNTFFVATMVSYISLTILFLRSGIVEFSYIEKRLVKEKKENDNKNSKKNRNLS